MQNLPRPIAIFDLDGTLVDTAADLTGSLVHAIDACGFAAPEASSLRDHAGTGGRGMLARWARSTGRVLMEDEVLRILTVFLAHYEGGMPGVSRPYPGAIAFIGDLRAAGWRTAICTNKPQKLADRLIGLLGLSGHFDALCGADHFAYRKPDPRHVIGTAEVAGGDAAFAVMFGDSENDILAAHAAKVPVIAFDFGYSPVPVSDFSPTLIASTYAGLTPDLLMRLINARSA
jgi:phosphoglycolate phosphatase